MNFVVVGLMNGVTFQLEPEAFDEIRADPSGIKSFKDKDGSDLLINLDELAFVACSTPESRKMQMWHELQYMKEKQAMAAEINQPINQLGPPS